MHPCPGNLDWRKKKQVKPVDQRESTPGYEGRKLVKEKGREGEEKRRGQKK